MRAGRNAAREVPVLSVLDTSASLARIRSNESDLLPFGSCIRVRVMGLTMQPN